MSNHNLSLGDSLWESVRSVIGYTKSELELLPHQSEDQIKPCLESLDLSDTSWTDKRLLLRLRDDLELHLKHRHAFLKEKKKRQEKKFKVKNFVSDKNFEAAKDRDQNSAIAPSDVLQRLQRIDFSSRQIKITDDRTMSGLDRVRELVLADNDIEIVSSLPPNIQLAVLSSNEIHRIDLSRSSNPCLRSLVALSVAGNCLSSLSFVDQLPSLAHLDVSFNCISSAEKDVACPQVAAHKNLQEIQLQGNPLCLTSLTWRSQVDNALKACGSSIKVVDGKPVVASSSIPSSSKKQEQPSLINNNNSNNNISDNTNNNNLTAPSSLENTSHPTTQENAASEEIQQHQQQKNHHQIYSDMAIYFQVLNVRGFNDLSQRYFDLQSPCSKVLASFYNATILESLNYQYNSPNGGLQPGQQGGAGSPNSSSAAAASGGAATGGGGSSNKKSNTAAQQQHAAAVAQNPALGNPGSMSTHEAVMNLFCKEVSTSVKVQVLWFNQQNSNNKQQSLLAALSPSERKRHQDQSVERILQLDELIAIGGATNPSGEDLTAVSADQQQNQNQQQTSSSNQKSSKKSASSSKHTGGSSSKSGAASSAAAAAKEATALAQREQQLQQALQLAASEFVLPVPRPTLSREVMLPVRVGLIFSVVPSSSSSSVLFSQVYNPETEPAPVAVLGWASLSPADLITGYCTTTTIAGAKLGVDRATILTAKERVNKLQVQLLNIRSSLEKEIAENAWRRDTEQAYMNASVMAKSNRGGAGGMMKSVRGGGAAAASVKHHHHSHHHHNNTDDNNNSHFSPVPVNPSSNAPVTNASIQQIQMEMESFFQNQSAARKRADETCKKLIVELAVLKTLEGLADHAGRVVVDGKFTLQKASQVPGFDENGDEFDTNNGDNRSDRQSEQNMGSEQDLGGNNNVNAGINKRGKNTGNTNSNAAAGSKSAAAANKRKTR